MAKSSKEELPKPSASAPTLAVDVDDLYQQFASIKAAERDRHDFIEDLLGHLSRLSYERQESTKALRAKEMLASAYQDKFEVVEKDLDDLRRAIDCDLFVLVVIDGDDTLFKDEYIRDGVHGGQRAAQSLYQALFDYFKDKKYFKHDYKIVTKIYVNFTGLSKTYTDAGIVSSSMVFSQFVQGFNKMHDLMEIVDAGNGKEGVDSKVKAEFNLFRRNVQCRQIMFAGSGDNSYGNFLRPHAPASNRSETITLIEALPFARELNVLAPSFEVVRFDNILRNSKIVVGQTQRHDDPVTRPLISSSPSAPVLELSKTPPATYASRASNFNANSDVRKAAPEDKKAVTANRSLRTIYVNDLRQRIDKPIKNLDKDIAYKLKQLKLCNRHHLFGDCNLADFCSHTHGSALSPIELDNLRYVARLTPCPNGIYCNDPDCSNGHRCQYGIKCINWKNGVCWFRDDMHQVDVSNPKAVTIST